MTSQQLQADLQILSDAVQFVQNILPNAISADMLALLQKIQGDTNILNFVVALVNALLPQQPTPPAGA